MKRLLFPILALGVAVTLLAHSDHRGKAVATFDGKEVAIEYGRPELQGRDMLGRISPGGVWRLGADAATTLTSQMDLAFGDSIVPKGEYTLFAKLAAPEEWLLLVNSEKGVPVGQRDEAKDIAAIPLQLGRSGQNVEQLTISLSPSGDEGELMIAWGDVQLRTSFRVRQ